MGQAQDRAPEVSNSSVRIITKAASSHVDLRRNSYEALGLLPTLNPTASGGVEPRANRSESDEHSMQPPNAPEALGIQKEAPSIIPKGYGRIVRDANGNIVDVELGEEDVDEEKATAETNFPEDVDVSKQEGVAAWVSLASQSKAGSTGQKENHVVQSESLYFRVFCRQTGH